MRLFNASSLFNEKLLMEVLALDSAALQARLNEGKALLLASYNLRAYRLPEDFTTASYIIASNHLTDSDAPLFISYHYQLMLPLMQTQPALFVFAKENCFNGVSMPKELLPILEMEKVFPVDRSSVSGSMAAMKAAAKWAAEGEQPKHFLIFAQGTIFDINRDEAQDIEPGAFWLARSLGIPVLPAFIEQAVEGAENRLVFGEPIVVPKNCRDFEPFQQLWLERVIEAQNALEGLTGTPARPAMLDAEHQTRKRFK